MFRDFLDALHRNGLLVDIIAIKILINIIVVSLFMILFRGATGTKLGNLIQFLSSIIIIAVISYCVVEFFHWNLYITPMAFGFFGDVIVSRIVAKGFRENIVSGIFSSIMSKLSDFSKSYKEELEEQNKATLEKERESNEVKDKDEEVHDHVEIKHEEGEVSEEIRKRLQRRHRTTKH